MDMMHVTKVKLGSDHPGALMSIAILDTLGTAKVEGWREIDNGCDEYSKSKVSRPPRNSQD